ncbi:PAS domain-containing sensor histidine kinase [Candidatus Desantisbacteria bacterium]|nr:PAS domain-containing sensor histidine kinase [Candidatus Desantisbacteria bacterium]
MHDYTKEEILTKNITDLDAPESAIESSDRIKRVFIEKWIKDEIFHRKKDGTIFPVEISAGLIEINNHKYILAFDRDITERRKIEKLLKQTKDDLEKQNEKLKKLDKIKDGLIRDVSHELKTPVAKQKMQIDLLKQNLTNKGIKEKHIDDILNKIEVCIVRQENVINNILTLSRLEAGGIKYDIKPTRIDQVLIEVLDDYQIILETKNISVEKILPEITINSDKKMLFHVFSNLINNAIKYRNQSGNAHINILLEKNKKNVCVRIIDNGIGLNDNEKKLIFKRFYQASASSEGIGVGLNIAHIIITDLNGKISLESDGHGKGTTLTVEFPEESCDYLI